MQKIHKFADMQKTMITEHLEGIEIQGRPKYPGLFGIDIQMLDQARPRDF